jgi:hypothetical protein
MKDRALRWISLAAVGAAVMASLACSKSGGQANGQQPTSPPGSGSVGQAPPSSTPSGPPPATSEPTASSAVVLEDGRHPVLLTKIDTSTRVVTFDLIVFLTGEPAKAEWAKQHPSEPGPPNDYMIVNNNPKLRKLPVVSTATIRIINPDNFNPDDTLDVSLAKLADLFASGKVGGMFWITVKGQRITRVEQQFLP